MASRSAAADFAVAGRRDVSGTLQHRLQRRRRAELHRSGAVPADRCSEEPLRRGGAHQADPRPPALQRGAVVGQEPSYPRPDAVIGVRLLPRRQRQRQRRRRRALADVREPHAVPVGGDLTCYFALEDDQEPFHGCTLAAPRPRAPLVVFRPITRGVALIGIDAQFDTDQGQCGRTTASSNPQAGHQSKCTPR